MLGETSKFWSKLNILVENIIFRKTLSGQNLPHIWLQSYLMKSDPLLRNFPKYKNLHFKGVTYKTSSMRIILTILILNTVKAQFNNDPVFLFQTIRQNERLCFSNHHQTQPNDKMVIYSLRDGQGMENAALYGCRVTKNFFMPTGDPMPLSRADHLETMVDCKLNFGMVEIDTPYFLTWSSNETEYQRRRFLDCRKFISVR